MLAVLRRLARLKRLRGTPFDLFGRTAERRMERALIAQYEADMDRAQAGLTPATRGAAVALAALPLEIRGFGHVKAAAARAAARRDELLAALADGGRTHAHAAE
jgi:indolepyruvate ferredoxin oxidoreductase